MPCIYLSINHWNRHYDLKPFLYIGSNQNDEPNYFGSNKLIKEDLSVLGSEFFEKVIIEYFEQIDNTILRQKESDLLKYLDCANNQNFYNRTNTSLPGYRETLEEKKERIKKSVLTRKEIKEKQGFLVSKEKRKTGNKNHMFGKTILDFWIKKYGPEKAKEMWDKKSQKHSEKLKLKNPCKKLISEELFFKIIKLALQKLTKKEIAIKLDLNKWLVERYCNKSILKKYLSGEIIEGQKIVWKDILKK